MSTRPLSVCYRTSKPPTIDGHLDDRVWQQVAWIDLVEAGQGGPTRQPTRAAWVWDDGALYVAFHCVDHDIWGITDAHDQPIYDQEVVEVFLDADRDGHGYVEIEVSPRNAVLDLFMLWRDDVQRGLWDWDCEGLQTAVWVDGDPTRRDSQDRLWTVEMAIPWCNLVTAPNLPPADGDEWLANLYRIDRAEQGDEYSAWSPPLRLNYHTPSCFGRLRFSTCDVADQTVT